MKKCVIAEYYYFIDKPFLFLQESLILLNTIIFKIVNVFNGQLSERLAATLK
jgi:hypothetical protein